MSSSNISPDKQVVLDAERAINEQYIRRMEQLIKDEPTIIKSISVAQNAIWLGAKPKTGLPQSHVSPIVGRVVLDSNHPETAMLGDNLYVVGYRPGDPDEMGVEFINWAAPIAVLFFEGSDAKDGLAPFVHGRRTFVARHDDIIDFDDEVDVADDPFSRAAIELEIALPPGTTSLDELVGEPALASEVSEAGAPLGLEPEPLKEGSEKERHTKLTDAVLALDLNLQHVDALFTVMEQPKEGHMGRILGTMQQDQARLFTWPVSVPLIVQGQPGTGKTVSAVYRALWWAHSERRAERVARMGIVGPNELWVAHVNRELSSDLQGRDAEIRPYALPELLKSIVGLPNSPNPTLGGAIESSWALGRTIDRFVSTLRVKPDNRKMDQRVRATLELARQGDETAVPNPEHRAFFASLPRSWDEIRMRGQYLPMLASFALSLGAQVPGGPVGHLVVDEAQNVSPLEWKILKDHVLEPGGGWSLFGDINQRRSDHTHGSWEGLAVDLGLTDDDGHVEIQVLDVGFRSTKQIIKFANQLLPRGERSQKALRNGPEPAIVRTDSETARRAKCFSQVETLSDKFEGYVAWITTDRAAADRHFRESSRWARGPVRFTWERNDRMIMVLDANDASGLEYDAVVVEEPAAFEQNFGRDGVLYTSLTRANKELVVVHTKPLPGKLRARV